MAPLQFIGLCWLFGTLGAFPAAYEIMTTPEVEGDLSSPLALAVVSAALWPVAWVAMFIVTVRARRS